MKNKLHLTHSLALIAFVVLMMMPGRGWGQTTGDYKSNGTVNVELSTSTNWLYYNGSAWIGATSAPSTASSGNTITVLSGATWNSTAIATIATGVTLLHQGTTGVAGSWTAAITLNGTYVHNTISSAARVLGLMTCNTGSTVIYRGSSALNSAIAVAGRTYFNLTYESTSGIWTTSAVSGATATVINGDLYVGGSGAGTVVVNQSGGTMAITVVGNISVKASCTYQPPTGTFTISGNITNAGTFTLNNASSVIFNGTTNISGSGAVSFASGFTLNSTKSITLSSVMST